MEIKDLPDGRTLQVSGSISGKLYSGLPIHETINHFGPFSVPEKTFFSPPVASARKPPFLRIDRESRFMSPFVRQNWDLCPETGLEELLGHQSSIIFLIEIYGGEYTQELVGADEVMSEVTYDITISNTYYFYDLGTDYFMYLLAIEPITLAIDDNSTPITLDIGLSQYSFLNSRTKQLIAAEYFDLAQGIPIIPPWLIINGKPVHMGSAGDPIQFDINVQGSAACRLQESKHVGLAIDLSVGLRTPKCCHK